MTHPPDAVRKEEQISVREALKRIACNDVNSHIKLGMTVNRRHATDFTMRGVHR